MTSYADFYRQSIDQPDAFWAEQAKLIDWQQPFTRVCNYDKPPFAHWFEGGTTNLCHNAVDRHLKDRAGQAALIYVSTETGIEKTYSFAELHVEVQRMAASLKALEHQTLEARLAQHRGSHKALAAELGISERTLYRRLKTR